MNDSIVDWKPKKIEQLETRFGKGIVDIFKDSCKKYNDIVTQCMMLGISIPYFCMAIKKYCKEDYLTFMAKNTVGKRKAEYVKKLQDANIYEVAGELKWIDLSFTLDIGDEKNRTTCCSCGEKLSILDTGIPGSEIKYCKNCEK